MNDIEINEFMYLVEMCGQRYINMKCGLGKIMSMIFVFLIVWSREHMPFFLKGPFLFSDYVLW